MRKSSRRGALSRSGQVDSLRIRTRRNLGKEVIPDAE